MPGTSRSCSFSPGAPAMGGIGAQSTTSRIQLVSHLRSGTFSQVTAPEKVSARLYVKPLKSRNRRSVPVIAGSCGNSPSATSLTLVMLLM